MRWSQVIKSFLRNSLKSYCVHLLFFLMLKNEVFQWRIQPQHLHAALRTSTLDTNSNGPHKSKHATEHEHLKWVREGWVGQSRERERVWRLIFLQYETLRLHIPPLPAYSKSHTMEVTKRNKQEKISTFYTS